mgnify:CR=1 FL=1
MHYIDYGDPPEVRQARKRGELTAELAARCPVLSEAEESALAQAEAVIARDLPLDLQTRAPNLRWVQAIGAGIEQLDPAGLAALDITLTNASGIAAAPIAEFVLGQVLAIWKNLRLFDQQQAGKIWKRQETTLVAGKTFGIVGLGAIGRATAKRARAFDMRVIATSRRALRGEMDPDADELYPPGEVSALLGQSDVVLASLPATPETDRFFDAEIGRAHV